MNITGVPETAEILVALTLTGTVVPETATNKTITWSIADAGTTQPVLSGNTLTASTTGTVTLRASIANGLADSGTFTKDFKINVKVNDNAPKYALTLNASEGGRVVWGSGQYGAGETVSIFAETLLNYRFDRWVNAAGGSFAGEYLIKTNFVMPPAPVTLTATFVANSSALTGVIENNRISPSKFKFYAATPEDIVIDMKKNQNFSLVRVRNGADILVRDEDYIMEGSTCVITAQYLSTLARGDKVLTFDLSAGASPQLIVTITK